MQLIFFDVVVLKHIFRRTTSPARNGDDANSTNRKERMLVQRIATVLSS